MSAQTRVMAQEWLRKVRGEGGGGGARAPAGDISDDDSSSDNDDGRATLNVGPKAKAIAKQWLQVCAPPRWGVLGGFRKSIWRDPGRRNHEP